MKAYSETSTTESQHHEVGRLPVQLPLRIGYDGKRAANNLTGLGNYSRSLIEHLAEQFPRNQYFIYTPKVKLDVTSFSIFSKGNVRLKIPSKDSRLKFLWRSYGITKQLQSDQIDLFHGLSHEIPFGLHHTGIKGIVTIHDLIFLKRPEYYTAVDRYIYEVKSKYACKMADRIIAISEKTKQDIIELYHTSPDKIDVIYQSCDDSFKQPVSASEKSRIKQAFNLPDRYLLNVGTIEARKNLLQLIYALPKIDSSYHLVVVGKQTKYFDNVKKCVAELNLEKRVIFLNKVPFDALPSIYQMATAFVLPSFYEGFGIPVIEALYSNVPVIAAKGSCLEEAGGPDSLYFSPHNVEELANTVNKVLLDEVLQQRMKIQGSLYVQKFNNSVVNQQLMDCYLKTLQQ